MSDVATRAFLWLVLILSAPWALVLLVALLRGYRISIRLTREGAQRRRQDE